jgi:hypothetical protein
MPYELWLSEVYVCTSLRQAAGEDRPEEIRSFQVYLTTEKKLAPGTIAISNAALRFLYNVTLQRHWVLEEVLPMPQIPDTLPVFSALKKFWSLKFS